MLFYGAIRFSFSLASSLTYELLQIFGAELTGVAGVLEFVGAEGILLNGDVGLGVGVHRHRLSRRRRGHGCVGVGVLQRHGGHVQRGRGHGREQTS